MSDYILTYSKIKFYPLEPVKEDIKIEDIAHSLSLMTRANGHCSHFYSVAQHSIHCYQEAKSRGYSKRVQHRIQTGSEALLKKHAFLV